MCDMQTFADVLNVDHKKTSVPDVLPSGQCFNCTRQKTMLTS